MARIAALIKLAIVVAIVSSSISYFQINTHLADMFGTEDLRNSTIQFLESLRCKRVTWYSNILVLLFWCHLAIYAIGCIKNIRTAAKTTWVLCCTTARSFIRFQLTVVGLFTTYAIHSSYDGIFPDRW